MKEYYKVKYNPKALPENIIQGEKYRITVLTDCLIRLEYAKDGKFEDRATQVVINRDFPPVKFTETEKKGRIIIKTAALRISYDGKEFTEQGLVIEVKDRQTSLHDTWYYGKKSDNLKGTARTLDNVNGSEIELESGVISKSGYAVLDDSEGLIQDLEGWVKPGSASRKDIYFWGYGHDYKDALRDFYYLCGKTPMLPRFALGNWWSRYYPYSQVAYIELMEHFEKEQIPFSVAVLDMEWHLVDIDPKYGTGWTGFTWNTQLFPERKEFMETLHRKGMKVTLNLHPSDGIRGFEKSYKAIGQHMQVNTEEEEPVLFDASDPEFMQYYFQDVIHPLEEEGVDFWWLDWQQGNSSAVKNLDPLWVLNHYHFLDIGRAERRPLILSRYVGPGSHRYPVGFSGDTVISWESLDFQPYFTSTASNIGYSWWSHDIGGHMLGYKNEELLIRWIQFGVFSPIMRLHSTNCDFNSKEPWRHTQETAGIMGEFLRLRHRLIPYIYTMNWKNYSENIPFIRPLYYEYPNCEEAYHHKNEYYFGTQLLVAPVTSETIPKLHVAKTNMWIPKGIWYDIFLNRVYLGNRNINIYREIDKIPVFAKAGTILPMTDKIYGQDVSGNPAQLHIYAYLGEKGEFTLYEDDCNTTAYQQGKYAKTEMEVSDEKDGTIFFLIHASKGEQTCIPEKRSYVLEMVGATEPTEKIIVKSGKQEVESCWSYKEEGHVLIIEIPDVFISEELLVEMPINPISKNSVQKDIFDFLDKAEISYVLKEEIYARIIESMNTTQILSQLQSMEIDKDIMGTIVEILTACL